MGRRQRGMPAQRHFHRRCEPAQLPGTLTIGHQIGRFGDIVLCRNRLQHGIGQEPTRQRHDAGLVAFEGCRCKSVDLIEGDLLLHIHLHP